MTFSYMDGRLEFLQAVPSVAEPGGVPNSGADLHLAPDGRFLYVSNRGQDSITVFSVQADGTLQLVPVSYTHLDVYKRQVHAP